MKKHKVFVRRPIVDEIFVEFWQHNKMDVKSLEFCGATYSV